MQVKIYVGILRCYIRTEYGVDVVNAALSFLVHNGTAEEYINVQKAFLNNFKKNFPDELGYYNHSCGLNIHTHELDQ